MLFWILVGIAILVVVVVFVRTGRSYYSYYGNRFDLSEASTVAGITALVSAMALFIAWIILSAVAGPTGYVNLVGTSEVKLTALNTDSAISGRSYFLGSGYVDEKQVLTYVYQNEDGAYRLDRSNADDSYVWEDEEKAPYLVIEDYELQPNPWLSPFALGWTANDVYHFHIPKGSVLSNYEVSP